MSFSFSNDSVFYIMPGAELEMSISFNGGQDIGVCLPVATPTTQYGWNDFIQTSEVMSFNFRKRISNTLSITDDHGTKYQDPVFTYGSSVKNTGEAGIYFNMEG